MCQDLNAFQLIPRHETFPSMLNHSSMLTILALGCPGMSVPKTEGRTTPVLLLVQHLADPHQGPGPEAPPLEAEWACGPLPLGSLQIGRAHV